MLPNKVSFSHSIWGCHFVQVQHLFLVKLIDVNFHICTKTQRQHDTKLFNWETATLSLMFNQYSTKADRSCILRTGNQFTAAKYVWKKSGNWRNNWLVILFCLFLYINGEMSLFSFRLTKIYKSNVVFYTSVHIPALHPVFKAALHTEFLFLGWFTLKFHFFVNQIDAKPIFSPISGMPSSSSDSLFSELSSSLSDWGSSSVTVLSS